jgi:hypothetical protein
MTMTTRTINASIISQAISRTPTVVGECGPTQLAETELDHVAAAGSKPGTSGGSCCPVLDRPPRPK